MQNKIITDLEIVKADDGFKKSLKSVNNISGMVKIISIKTQTDYDRGGEIRVKLKTVYKEIEGKRKTFVDPLNLVVKNLNAEFMPKLATITGIVRDLDGKMIAYQDEVEKAAIIERKKVEKANAKKMDKFENQLADGKSPEVPVFKTTKIVPETKTKSKGGGSSYVTKVVDFKIIDKSKIPMDYYLLDEKRIRKVITAGGVIPGVERTESKTMGTRV